MIVFRRLRAAWLVSTCRLGQGSSVAYVLTQCCQLTKSSLKIYQIHTKYIFNKTLKTYCFFLQVFFIASLRSGVGNLRLASELSLPKLDYNIVSKRSSMISRNLDNKSREVTLFSYLDKGRILE